MKKYLPKIITGAYVWLMVVLFCLYQLTNNEIFMTLGNIMAGIILVPALFLFITGIPIAFAVIVIREISTKIYRR